MSPAIAMFLMCVLPLLMIYALAFAGIVIHPLLPMIVLIVCCLVMFQLMGGACAHADGEHETKEGELRTEEPAEAATEFPGVQTDDVFRPTTAHRQSKLLAWQGELLQDPDTAYETLEKRFQGTGVTPLLQEDESGRPRLIIVPGEPACGLTSRQRSPWLNVLLFVATLATTTWAGALHQGVDLWQEPGRFAAGLPYSLSLMLILGAHELGHYIAARAHHMKVTLPFFIPVPFALGTFGAFIQLKSPSKNRRALFDVGVAGPLAGLVFAVPALWIGLKFSTAADPAVGQASMHQGASVGSSVLLTFLAKLTLGDAIAEGHVLTLHPLAFAGWLGLLVTALNLLPIGQLDGGHIADAMFGRRIGATISTVAIFSLVMLGLFVWSGLLVWAFIAFFIAGSKGLPPLNDVSRLGATRTAIGGLAFVLLFLILIPVPHAFYKSLGVHCPYL